MKSWTLITVLASAMGALAACSANGGETGEGGGDPSGGNGAGGVGGTSASSSTAASTSATSGTGGSEPQKCDDRGLQCGASGNPGCQGCAVFEGSCGDEFSGCGGFQDPNDPCYKLNQCRAGCPTMDDPGTPENERVECVQTCDMEHADGVEPFSKLYFCIFCEECPASCGLTPEQCGL